MWRLQSQFISSPVMIGASAMTTIVCLLTFNYFNLSWPYWPGAPLINASVWLERLFFPLNCYKINKGVQFIAVCINNLQEAVLRRSAPLMMHLLSVFWHTSWRSVHICRLLLKLGSLQCSLVYGRCNSFHDCWWFVSPWRPKTSSLFSLCSFVRDV